MVTGVEPATAEVDIAKAALTLPAGTITVAGTVTADDELLLSDTTAPPFGAVPFSVTVPWDEDLPRMLAGLKVNVLNTRGLTVSAAVFVTPP